MAQPDFKTLKERVGIDDAGSLVGYRLAVDHEDVAQLGHLSLGVVMVYYRLIVYH